MLERFISAINAIGSQPWAFLLVLLGVISVVVFHRNGLDVAIAAGIIGAGVNMFTGKSPASPGTQVTTKTTTQQVETATPAAVEAAKPKES